MNIACPHCRSQDRRWIKGSLTGRFKCGQCGFEGAWFEWETLMTGTEAKKRWEEYTAKAEPELQKELMALGLSMADQVLKIFEDAVKTKKQAAEAEAMKLMNQAITVMGYGLDEIIEITKFARSHGYVDRKDRERGV